MKFNLYKKYIKQTITIHYVFINTTLKLLKWIVFGNNNKTKNTKKIIIFCIWSLGDNICALPSIYSIRKNFLVAQIDISTNAGAENFVSLGALIGKSSLLYNTQI